MIPVLMLFLISEIGPVPDFVDDQIGILIWKKHFLAGCNDEGLGVTLYIYCVVCVCV